MRIRFTIAHELGHYILHASVLKQISFSSTDEWKIAVQQLPEHVIKRAEKQAWIFGAAVLMPRHLVINELKNMRPLIDAASEISTVSGEIIDYVAPKLARKFDVSNSAMIKRIKGMETDIFSV